MRPKARSVEAFNRIYGSRERAKIMAGRPCDTCGRPAKAERPNQNSHVAPAGEKGVGWKGGWEWVITQCKECHRALERFGSVELLDKATGKDHRAIARKLAEEIKP